MHVLAPGDRLSLAERQPLGHILSIVVRRLAAAAGSSALLLAIPAYADRVQQGVAAGARGDFAASLAALRPLANAGNPLAQAAIGYMYAYGKGTPKDPVQAWMWLDLAVERLPGSQEPLRRGAAAARDALTASMTPAQLADARLRRMLWIAK